MGNSDWSRPPYVRQAVDVFQEIVNASTTNDILSTTTSSSSSIWTEAAGDIVTVDTNGGGSYDYSSGGGGGGGPVEDGEYYLNLFVLITLVSIPIWLTLLPKWLIKLWMTYLIKVKTGKIPSADEEYPEYDWDSRPPILDQTEGPPPEGILGDDEMAMTVNNNTNGLLVVNGSAVEYELLFTNQPFTNGTQDVPLFKLPDSIGTNNDGNMTDGFTNKENVTLPIFRGDENQGSDLPDMPAIQPRLLEREARRFLVRIEPKGVDYILCLGSLVNERYVLTVAHCIDQRAAVHLESLYQTRMLSVSAGPAGNAMKETEFREQLRRRRAVAGLVEKIDVPLSAAILPNGYAGNEGAMPSLTRTTMVRNQLALGLLRLPQPFSKDSNVAPISMSFLRDAQATGLRSKSVSLAGWVYRAGDAQQGSKEDALKSSNDETAAAAGKTAASLLTYRLDGAQCTLNDSVITCRGLSSNNPFCQAQGLGGLPVTTFKEETGKFQLIGVQVYGDCRGGLFHGLFLPDYKEFITNSIQ